MKRRAGFTVVELAITITIMVILVTLAVVNLRGSQAQARDDERKTDVSNLSIYLDMIYVNGLPSDPTRKGSYPNISAMNSSASLESTLPEIDKKSLRAPDVEAPSYSVVVATNATQSTSGVQPQPTVNTYVYQPLASNGSLCTGTECRRYNLFYREETTNLVRKVMSKHQ